MDFSLGLIVVFKGKGNKNNAIAKTIITTTTTTTTTTATTAAATAEIKSVAVIITVAQIINQSTLFLIMRTINPPKVHHLEIQALVVSGRQTKSPRINKLCLVLGETESHRQAEGDDVPDLIPVP